MTPPARVVVVGGGLVGSAIAFHLARRQVAEIVVLDAGYPAASTRRSAAVVRRACADPVLSGLAHLSLQQFAVWPDLMGDGCDYRATGAVIVASGEDASRLAADGITAPATDEELAARLPWYRIPAEARAYVDPQGGTVDPRKARRSLQGAARRLGVRIEPGVRVDRLLTSGSTVHGVCAGGAALFGDLVVLATGPWTPRLLTSVDRVIPLRTSLTALAVIAAPAVRLSLPIIDLAGGLLLRPYRGRYVLAGSRHAVSAEPAAEMPPRPDMHSLVAQLDLAAPALAQGSVRARWSGYYDMSPDARPIVGALPELAGLLVAAGLSGGGVKLAPAIGLLTAESIGSGRASNLLAACGPERFLGQPSPPAPAWIPEWQAGVQTST